MIDWIWDEGIWFPANETGRKWGWKDLENVPGSQDYIPQVRDLHWSVLLGVILLIVRYMLNRAIVIPLGYYLGVSKASPRKVKSNPVLEGAYAKSKKVSYTEVQRLSKQTDLTTRQIEVWLRDRRKQDSPSPIQKFSECSWHFVFYGIAFVYGMCVLRDAQWFWTTKHCWTGWPKIHIANDIYWYYMIELGFYWSLIFTLFTDHKRKDFTEMIVHHIATVVLLYFSWIMNFVRVGTLVLLVHDASDPWLAIAKMSKYMKHSKATDAFFAIFLLVWIITRLGLYPFVVLYCTTVEPYGVIMEHTFFAHWFFNFFLYILFVLHLMWSYSIYQIAANKLRKGEVDDVRSDTEDEDSDECDGGLHLQNNVKAGGGARKVVSNGVHVTN